MRARCRRPSWGVRRGEGDKCTGATASDNNGVSRGGENREEENVESATQERCPERLEMPRGQTASRCLEVIDRKKGTFRSTPEVPRY